MPLDLDQWHRDVSKHLDMIEAGADIIVRHTEHLTIRPVFETMAEADLKRAETTLTRALDKVRQAQEIYRDKETGE